MELEAVTEPNSNGSSILTDSPRGAPIRLSATKLAEAAELVDPANDPRRQRIENLFDTCRKVIASLYGDVKQQARERYAVLVANIAEVIQIKAEIGETLSNTEVSDLWRGPIAPKEDSNAEPETRGLSFSRETREGAIALKAKVSGPMGSGNAGYRSQGSWVKFLANVQAGHFNVSDREDGSGLPKELFPVEAKEGEDSLLTHPVIAAMSPDNPVYKWVAEGVVVINGTDYQSPVDALKDSQSLSSVQQAFRNVVRYRETNLDNYYRPADVREACDQARLAAQNLKLVFKVDVAATKTREGGTTKRSVPLFGTTEVKSAAPIVGAFIVELLDQLHAQKRRLGKNAVDMITRRLTKPYVSAVRDEVDESAAQ